MDECFVTGGTARGMVWRRTNVESLARATLHGLPFPVSDTSRKDALSAPFFCLLFFGRQRKVGAAPHRGNANKPEAKQGKAPPQANNNNNNNNQNQNQKQKKPAGRLKHMS
ncbi:hypothetical protein P3T23_001230 [Paraburkholderia sp. GAS448]|uniref:hypothetical protein n=1 Tax=Paraburkholderia sp. GAS448 TaxID=3035136 RepID=UPI003D1E4F8C